MTEVSLPDPNAKFLDGVNPTIEWAGKTWPIPLLAPRENRHVIPALMRSGRVLAHIANPAAPPLTTEQFDDVMSIIFWGLKRAHPTLTREAFDDVAMSGTEMGAAVTVVSNQTGIMSKGDGTKANAGEQNR